MRSMTPTYDSDCCDAMDGGMVDASLYAAGPASLPSCVVQENMMSTAAADYTDDDSTDYTDLKPMSSNHYGAEHLDETDSWRTRHPTSWGSTEVLAWLTHVAMALPGELDLAQLRLENFHACTGRRLGNMTQQEFETMEPQYGHRLYLMFQELMGQSHYNAPADLDTYMESYMTPDLSNLDLLHEYDGLDALPCADLLFDYTDMSDVDLDLDLRLHRTLSSSEDTDTSGYGTDGSSPDRLSDSITSSVTLLPSPPPSGHDHHQQQQQQHTALPPMTSFLFQCNSSPDQRTDYSNIPSVVTSHVYTAPDTTPRSPEPTKVVKRGRPRKQHLDDATGSPVKSHRGRKQATKGSHLWEFVRDLLLDQQHNPSVIRWENRDDGVFRFVKSEAVAKMWGQRKNNNTMTYEKLSRAMRFCRTSNFFSDVPKDRSFPKKLCFRFGTKATGWQQDTMDGPSSSSSSSRSSRS